MLGGSILPHDTIPTFAGEKDGMPYLSILFATDLHAALNHSEQAVPVLKPGQRRLRMC